MERACQKPSMRKILSRNGGCIGFSNRTNEREDRQGIHLNRDESFWTKFCEELWMGAHIPTNLFLATVHLRPVSPGPDPLRLAKFRRPNTCHDHCSLHVSEGKNMDADPMRKLRKSHVPVLDPIALFLFSLGHKKSLKRHHRWRPQKGSRRTLEEGDDTNCRHKTSGQRKRSAPTMMVLPSGSLQVVSLPVLSAVDFANYP